MDMYIRDTDGNLCVVLFKTATYYHVERVKDRSKAMVPVNAAELVQTLESFPGDWAIKADGF